MIENIVSIVLWGEIEPTANWCDWYKDSKEFINSLGYTPTHIGIDSPSYTKGKVLTIARMETGIIKKLENGECPASMSVYSLPVKYKTATFDYLALSSMTNNYALIVLKESDYSKDIEIEAKTIMKKYISLKEGEVFLLSQSEVPMIYTMSRKSEYLRTYRYLHEIC